MKKTLLQRNNMQSVNTKRHILDYFRKARFIAITTLLSLLFQLGYPAVSWALTGGPTSPDFASFEPVGTTNMVNEFTGQFVYNLPVLEVPGANGGGYALSLSYHSGDGPESEASWVGDGWTLSPGCINRMKRGIPDDYNKIPIKYYNDVPKNWTIAATGFGSLQFYSNFAASLTGSTTVRYNNYKGFGFSKQWGLSVWSGLFSLGYTYAAGDGKFSASANPAAILSFVSNLAHRSPSFAGSQVGRAINKVTDCAAGQFASRAVTSFVGQAASQYISYLLTDMTSPYNLTPYTGKSVAGYVSMTENPTFVQVGFTEGLNVSYTYQKNIPERNVPAYGYMYSGSSRDNTEDTLDAIMDYTIENESTFDPRDMYLPVPTSTPDAFFVSGEGIGGAFRMYNENIGVFSPNYVSSPTSFKLFGFDGHALQTSGTGGETYLDGEHDLTVHSYWSGSAGGMGNTNEFKFVPYNYTNDSGNISEGSFFRFNSDLGGSVDYDGSTQPVWAAYGNNGPILPSSIKTMRGDYAVPDGNRSGRSSYIGYHTNGEINTKYSGTRLKTYEHNSRINYLAGRDDSYNDTLNHMIGEVAVTNEDGNNYVYGLPTYAADCQNMMRGITPTQSGKYLINANIDNKRKVGEQYLAPYITSYLLTQITTPDYVDINLNGPDAADLGGYTRFTYKPVYWSTAKVNTSYDNWYRWRTPYRGVYYNPLRLSDNQDDMGSYQSGYKEVYVLDTIETKTHYAVFRTQDRLDGWSARRDDKDAALGYGVDTNQDKPLQMLKEINLYAKSTDPGVPDKLIKTVHFQYDYSSWPGVPNNYGGTGTNTGKLTLKRVWFEYNGVVNASISPYEFEYTYPTSAAYPSKYSALVPSGVLNDTPSYTPYIDAWGNYQYDGANRRNNLQSWTDQTPGASFDPAAWQLKRIILPSGGEIHIQYEQNTYAYVQDRMATAMVRITGDPGDTKDEKTFYLNLNDLDMDAGDKTRLAQAIYNTYMVRKSPTDSMEKMYYKFFYTLQGSDPHTVIGSCNADYIEGFATVTAVGVSGGNVYVTFQDPIPYNKCIDYIQKEIGGKLLSGGSSCSVPNNFPNDPGGNGNSTQNVISQLKSISTQFVKAVVAEIAPKTTYCKARNADLSYLRIPIWNKKGGGVRVKRLLMYDKGVDPGAAALYGTEYIYDNPITGQSYGVATNEPYENHEENPLVNYLYKRQGEIGKKWRKLFNGHDDEQFKGPLSMNALPSASVGYSKVIKRNIHQDKYTGTGFSVMEYYTAKDYPFDGYYSSLGTKGVNHTSLEGQMPNKPSIHFGFFSYDITGEINTTQGYCFIQNQMHGQLKKVSDYPGNITNDIYGENTSTSPVSQKTYDYYQPGEQVPMFDYDNYSVYYDQPGKEADITVDRRGVEDVSHLTRLTGDITVGMVTPVIYIPYVIAFPVTSTSVVRLNSMVVNKVIHYPAILKSVTVVKDGFQQQTENVAFDPLTCHPVVTRTRDGYDGLTLYANPDSAHKGKYTQYNITASSQYPQMGQKAWNERYVYSGVLSVGSGPGTHYTLTGLNSPSMFTPGDLIALHSGTSIKLANIVDMAGTDAVIDIAGRYTPGVTITGTYNKIEILRSGFTNQLKASAGGFIEYGDTFNSNKGKAALLMAMNKALKDLIPYKGFQGWPKIITIPLSEYNGTLIYWDYTDACSHTEQKVYYLKLIKDYTSSGYEYDMVPCDVTGTVMPYPHGGSWLWKPNMTAVANSLSSKFTYPDGFVSTGQINPNPPPWAFFHLESIGAGLDYEYPIWWCASGEDSSQGVLKATVTSFKDDWDYDPALYTFPSGLNDFETGKRGKWRPYETYVLDDTTIEGSNPTKDQRNYNMAGVTRNFVKVPWKEEPITYPKIWTKTSEVRSYTPNGFSTEEMGQQYVASSAKFGYYGALPYMAAQNAPYASIRFESFENSYGGSSYLLEDGVSAYNGFVNGGHTGLKSFLLTHGSSGKLTFPNVLDSSGQGHVIRFWADVSVTNTSNIVSSAWLTVKALPSPTNLPIKYIGRSGNNNWALFEVVTPGGTPGNLVDIEFEVPTGSISPDVPIVLDDIKIQPVGSKATAYVYDTRSYRLWAIFDDDHFPVIYQYNGEGKLVRKKRETFNGTKTTEEAQYHTPARLSRDNMGNYY